MRKSIAIMAALGLLSTGLTPVVAAPLHKMHDFSAASKKKDEKAKDEKSKDKTKAKTEKKSQLGTTDFSAAAKKKNEKAEAKKKDEKKEDKKK